MNDLSVYQHDGTVVKPPSDDSYEGYCLGACVLMYADFSTHSVSELHTPIRWLGYLA